MTSSLEVELISFFLRFSSFIITVKLDNIFKYSNLLIGENGRAGCPVKQSAQVIFSHKKGIK